MDVVQSLTQEQWRSHHEQKAEWFKLAVSTAPVDRMRLRAAVDALFAEMSLPQLGEFLYYGSPSAALADFQSWKDKTAPFITCFWSYQLPLCDPEGYWRAWQDRGEIVDLAVRRRPNTRGCFCYGEPLDQPGALVTKLVLQELWDASKPPAQDDWCGDVLHDLRLKYLEELDFLEDRMVDEDPTCQMPSHEFYLLGPLPWILREVSCSATCASVLGCRRNEAFYRPLEEILRWGSLIFVFQNLCIICERPRQFQGIKPRPLYADGYAPMTR
jgi:hypothetical protein